MTTRRLIFGILFVFIGLSALTNFDWFHYAIPFIFIFIGLRILLFRKWCSRAGAVRSSELHQDEINEIAIFSGSDKRVITSSFTGGKAVAVFSGMQIDLSEVKSKAKTMELELVAVFGGLKVIIPKGWRVSSEGAGVMGGFSNLTSGGTDASPRLHVKGVGVFGGVEIIN
ncbi:MAG TPA: hypothetical protein VMR81_07470 [Patescibacteria group bacterium]|jgi:hypothetical protein|nr:hypothetical protein [Patescibacteria group bacterium]